MIRSIVPVGAGGARGTAAVDRLLTPALRDRIRTDANRWIKRLRLVPYDGRTMRERFTYRGDSLWWFTEIYLHKMRRLEQALETIVLLEQAVAAHAPARLEVAVTNPASAAAARAFAAARRLPVEVRLEGSPRRGVDKGLLVGVSALLSRLRPARRAVAGAARVAAFVHTAFWRGERPDDPRESYIGDVLDALRDELPAGGLQLVGLGPHRSFRARRWWDPLVGRRPPIAPIEAFAPRAALAESLALWTDRDRLAAELTTGEAIREAARIGEYDLWPVLEPELVDAARVQWTWSARAMDEARAALRSLRPDVIVTYAEAGGWGRALVLEARRLGIPSVGLQHGFIYRHWLNYQHEPDEMTPLGETPGFPHPTRTLLFDGHAADTLMRMGHFPPDALVVTGSARRDALAARVTTLANERPAIRRELGVGTDDALVVLAAKASEIGPHLPALFDAVRSRPGVRLIIKPHPAETADPYERAGATGPITVLPADADLGRLLAAADLLVTMNSTVAVDALVLGIPALVVGLPNNLSPFVDAGVMAGATADEETGAALQRLLYDRTARDGLAARGRAFAAANGMEAAGDAAQRAVSAILATAAGRAGRS